jgi:Glycosyl transferases group 1
MVQLNSFADSRPLESLRVLFIGGYWMGANDVVRMYLCGLQDLGVSVREYCTDDHRDVLDHGARPYCRGTQGPVYLKWDALRPVVEEHDPDMIVCCAGGLAFSPEISAQLRETRCLIGMAMSDPDGFPQTTEIISNGFDHFFTNHAGIVEGHRKAGANAHWLPFPCYPKFHYRRPLDPRFDCDVIVAGDGRDDRAKLVTPLCREFDVKVFGDHWAQYGIDAIDLRLAPKGLIGAAFSSATMALDFARNLAGLPIAKLRLFEIAACGGIACTERSPELPVLFSESEVVSFADETELVNRVGAILDNPGRAAEMQRNAYWRAHSEHTVEHRWRTILAHCGVRTSDG